MFISLLDVSAQNEEITNTYVNTFNQYFYPFGDNYFNENSCWYNPYGQFRIHYPTNISGCQPNGNSRFNLINIDYLSNLCYYGNNVYKPGLYCDDRHEIGPGINNSGSVRVTIKNGGDNGAGANWPRSRVEMCYYPKHFNGTAYTADVENETYYYRWSFFIPNDGSFPDKETPNSFHIISQFHQVNWVETFDPVTGVRTSDPINNPVDLMSMQAPLHIVYAHEENAPDNKRNIHFLYGYRPDNGPTGGLEDRSSGFKIIDGITKGAWNTIILKIKWSPYDNIGFIRAWVNGQIGYNSNHAICCEPNNPNYGTTSPEKIYGANMNLTENGFPVSNYMQMGHYRAYLNTKASIYFDDLIITQDSLFAFNGFKTKLTSQFCDVDLSENLTIEATPLPKISKYKFKFSQINGPPFQLSPTMIRDDNLYNILDDESYFKPGETYSVEIAVKVEKETSYRNYHTSCTITIPTQTKLQSEFCDLTLDITNMEIKCSPIPNATNYKFRFTYDNTQTIVNSSVPSINLLDYNFIKPNKTYSVDIKVQGNNFDYPYGTSCSITTPFQTKIVDERCNSIWRFYTSNIRLSCYAVPNATNYKFRFKDGITTHWLNSSVPFIDLGNIAWFQYDKWYDVDVSVQGADFYLAYGECCPIYVYSKKLSLAHTCGVWLQKPHNIYPNPFTSSISIENADPTEKYQLFDYQGNMVREGNFLDSSDIELPSLKKGLYFIRIYLGKDEGVFYKIIKEEI